MAALSRRQMLSALGLGWLVDASLPARRTLEGAVVGADLRLGHALRDGVDRELPRAAPERAEVVIVGSGVSGASAAWRLAASGVGAELLELEPFAGGTSAWGEDGVVAHPWGAHYLPVPEPTARAPLRLLAELGVLTGWDAAGRALYDETRLCHAPEERLFHRGRWHRGLESGDVLSAAEKDELARFHERMSVFSGAVGADGRPAFAIPCAESSRDAAWLALDELTMDAWLAREGFTTSYLRWYVEYATRDDFGADLTDVSAWAALHYFASRRQRTEQTLRGSRYLVWPEGNGRLVRHMLERSGARRRHRHVVLGVEATRTGVAVEALDATVGEAPVLRRIEARAAILAVPGFIAARIARGARGLIARPASPWLVANLHVTRPVEADRAWDSVLYEALGLGYVDAGHQRMGLSEQTVLTYFRAYGGAEMAATRGQLAARRWGELAADVLVDLAAAHPELGEQTSRLDCMVWGHAMPRPRPGFLRATTQPFEPAVLIADQVAWAHVDQTGLALFEEANTHGVRAAEAVLAQLGVAASDSWI